MGETSKPSTLGLSQDIGFGGPRINAIGRIADRNCYFFADYRDDMGLALERAMQCEQINQRRQQLSRLNKRSPILSKARSTCSRARIGHCPTELASRCHWHCCLQVDRYGVPVFIGTYEDEQHIRGSARGIPEFHVFEALNFCKNLLGKFGGHKAAGGFQSQR